MEFFFLDANPPIKIKIIDQLSLLEHIFDGICALIQIQFFLLIDAFHFQTLQFNLLAVALFFSFHFSKPQTNEKKMDYSQYLCNIMAFQIFIFIFVLVYFFFSLLRFFFRSCVCSRFDSTKYLHFSSPEYLNKRYFDWDFKVAAHRSYAIVIHSLPVFFVFTHVKKREVKKNSYR